MRSQKAVSGGKRARKRPPRRKKRPRPKCPEHGKVCFTTQLEAVSAMATITRVPDDRKKPVRAYRCPACEAWHLTSLPKAA